MPARERAPSQVERRAVKAAMLDSLQSGPADHISTASVHSPRVRASTRRDPIGAAAFWLCPWDKDTFPGHWRHICRLWDRPYSTIKSWRRRKGRAPVAALEAIAAIVEADAKEGLRVARELRALAARNAVEFAKAPLPVWRARRIAAAARRNGRPCPPYAQSVLDAFELAKERPTR
jgi:hypothetical protein